MSTIYYNSSCNLAGLANSCQVSVSEYAYHHLSTTRSEITNAKCSMYPRLSVNTDTSQYIHCNGTQLLLANSDLGPEMYRGSVCYVFDGKTKYPEILFTFPTRVSLTTITLHYYSDSVRGLPELIFYAVPDDFDVWDILGAGNPHREVAAKSPGGEPAGRRNISVNVNFNTKKILMYKHESNFTFAVSEIEFFHCTSKQDSCIKMYDT